MPWIPIAHFTGPSNHSSFGASVSLSCGISHNIIFITHNAQPHKYYYCQYEQHNTTTTQLDINDI
eukprot:12258114-Ditylum_brightwellii.AAC.1